MEIFIERGGGGIAYRGCQFEVMLKAIYKNVEVKHNADLQQTAPIITNRPCEMVLAINAVHQKLPPLTKGYRF